MSADYDDLAETSPIAELMAELEKCRPANQRPFIDYPRTREDYEMSLAEDRAEQRRHG